MRPTFRLFAVITVLLFACTWPRLAASGVNSRLPLLAAQDASPRWPLLPVGVAVPVLSLRPREAAKALGISERTLWSLTAPRGPIPCKRLPGRAVLYRIADLDAWLAGGVDKNEGSDNG